MRRVIALTTIVLLGACAGPSPTHDRPVRALTPTEYNNTIRDLLGFAPGQEWPPLDEDDEDEEQGTADWPYLFPNEVGVEGFEGFAEGQVASAWSVEQAEGAARHFSAFIRVAPIFWTCEGVTSLPSDEGVACARSSVVRFAQRAWRRPGTPEELSRLETFHAGNVAEHGLVDGTILTVQGVLQTPSFLYLVEETPAASTGTHALNDWEVAARLSYFLWDSMPDRALFAEAEAGRLSTPEQVRAQARRMVDDPRAREAVVRFHSQWLQLEKVYANRADRALYAPVYTAELHAQSLAEDEQTAEELWSGTLIGTRTAMVREAELFVEKTVFEGGGTLEALLTDHHGFASRVRVMSEEWDLDTAQLYNATPLGDTYERLRFDDGNLEYLIELRPAEYPADERSGILTMGAVLAGRSHPVHPAPVLRGVFMMERLACEPMGQPPDSAAGATPPDTLGADSTNRERVASVTAARECAGCHDRINPLGFAFEHYDSLGGRRETDTNGAPIDASGTLSLAGEEPQTFANAVELGRRLAASDAVHDCYARTWLRYALGRREAPSEAEGLAWLQDRFRTGDRGDVRDLLVDIAASNLFLTRPTTAAEQRSQ